MKKHIKGQAALEFLTTYGWAFLVILIMIGAMAYFGFLKPTRLLPESCIFTAGFACPTFEIKELGTSLDTISFEIQNKMSENINVGVGDVTANKTTGVGVNDCVGVPAAAITNWQSGTSQLFTVTGCELSSLGSQGDKIKVIVNLKYSPSSSSSGFKKTAQGELYATIQ